MYVYICICIYVCVSENQNNYVCVSICMNVCTYVCNKAAWLQDSFSDFSNMKMKQMHNGSSKITTFVR